MAEQRPTGLQISKQRMDEMLLAQYQNSNHELMTEVARLSAINEALMERLNEYVQRDISQVKAAGPDDGTPTS